LVIIALAIVMTFATTAPAQLLGGPGSLLGRLREKRSNKDTSIHYDPAVLSPGVSRQQVIAAFGKPNATQGEGTAREDVYAFFPDGAKFVEPRMSAGTIAAGVFTGGMSLAVRQARIMIQENQLTLYHVSYDVQDRIESVRTVPPELATPPPAAPGNVNP
jgi:hypothetical protein